MYVCMYVCICTHTHSCINNTKRYTRCVWCVCAYECVYVCVNNTGRCAVFVHRIAQTSLKSHFMCL